MTQNEIKSYFDLYPNSEIYKVGKRFFLSKDKNLAEDYARVNEEEVETINAKTKLGKEAIGPEAIGPEAKAPEAKPAVETAPEAKAAEVKPAVETAPEAKVPEAKAADTKEPTK